LALACNLGPVVYEETVSDSTDTTKFDQGVLELGETQLLLIFGDPV
jgi:hypothetical protein